MKKNHSHYKHSLGLFAPTSVNNAGPQMVTHKKTHYKRKQPCLFEVEMTYQSTIDGSQTSMVSQRSMDLCRRHLFYYC